MKSKLELIPAENGNSVLSIISQKEEVFDYLKDSFGNMAENTKKAYLRNWNDFVRWADHEELPRMETVPFLPAATSHHIAKYAHRLAEVGIMPDTEHSDKRGVNRKAPDMVKPLKLAGVKLAVASISKIYDMVITAFNLDCENPTKSDRVRQAFKNIARQTGVAQHQKNAVTVDILHALVESLNGDGAQDTRNKALLLLGFSGAFRRSELVALTVGDIEKGTGKDGRPLFIVKVRRSKTDQYGQGMEKAIFTGKDSSLCPVAAVKAWLHIMEESNGGILNPETPLFPRLSKSGKILPDPLQGRSVANIIKATAQKAGIEESLIEDFSGHSLRRGFVTSAVEMGASERSIMNQTGHKSTQMVRRYIERKNAIEDNAGAIVL